MKATRILVPLDGSKIAEAAIPEAAGMARGGECTLVLLHAAQARIPPGADVSGDQVEALGEGERYLAGVKAYLAKEGIAVETHVWIGPPAPAIVECARANKADLIVMTTHGRSGLGRLVFGSVAESVLRGTPLPILLVRPAGAPVQVPPGHAEPRPAAGIRAV